MKELKVDIRDVIVKLNDDIEEIEGYKRAYNKNDDAWYDEEEEFVENVRFNVEIDTLKRIRNEYLCLFELNLYDIDRYIKNKENADKVIEIRNINPVNTTGEVEKITYTIK
jgi:hypothetical protein